MIFNPFWITLTELLVVPGTSSTSPIFTPDIYIYIYIYILKTIQIRRTRHAGHCWRSRDELIRDVLLWIPTHGRAKAGRPARTYIQQLCEDTGCCPEDLPRAMNDREEWRERVRDIRAASTIWWWWWWYIYITIILVIYTDIEFVNHSNLFFSSILVFCVFLHWSYKVKWELSFFFSYWPGHLTFSTLLVTVFFHFVFVFTLFHAALNHSTISSSHCCSSLPIDHYQPLEYHSITALVHLLSVNLVPCPAELLLLVFLHTAHFALDILMQNYS